MQALHTPVVNARYWAALTLASVFGTNLGDLYAHDSGLSTGQGLALLALLFGLLLAIEARDRRAWQWHYWAAILIVRTSATNIADFFAFRLHVPLIALAAGLGVVLVALALWLGRASSQQGPTGSTGALFWVAMLTAGTFGTAMGDYSWMKLGIGPATFGLSLLWAIVYAVGRRNLLTTVTGYWLAVALVRTTGTAIGDYLAEGRFAHLGLLGASLCSGLLYVGLLSLWPTERARAAA
jgi:uncharacterized membrane-anchored protein